jgi:hypothetical protein
MKNQIIFAFALLCAAPCAFAQKNMKDWSGDACFKNATLLPKPKFYKADFINVEKDGHGKMPWYPAINLKKVAIVCMYVRDIELTKTQRFADATYTTSRSTTEKGVDMIGDAFLAAIPALKAAGKAQGTEIFTIDELTTDKPELRKIYDEFEIKASGFGNALTNLDKSLTEAGGKSDGITAVLANTRLIEGLVDDYKFAACMGNLAKALGVDAVISINMNVASASKAINAESMTLHIWGPNPIAKKDMKYVGFNGTGYNEGLYYSGLTFTSKKGVPIYTIGKKKLATEVGYDGLSTLVGNLYTNSVTRMDDAKKMLAGKK